MLAAARRIRERVGGDRLWRAVRPAYWSAVSALTGRTGVAMRLADGQRYHLDARLYAWQPHLHEPAVVRVLLDALAPDGVFLDVGAHVGLVTLIASRRVASGRGRVFAVEPSPSNVELLRRHVTANGVGDRVTVMHAVAGDRCARAVPFVYRPGECTANSMAYPVEGGLVADVPMTTIDALVRDRAVPVPDVVKIDVEGFEHHVLRGAADVLASARPVVIVALHPEPLEQLGASTGDVIAFMATLGYAAFHLDGRPVSSAGFEEVVFRKAS